MISSFDHYQNKYTGVNYLTKKDNKIQTNSEKDQYKNMNFYPFSTNSVLVVILTINPPVNR